MCTRARRFNGKPTDLALGRRSCEVSVSVSNGTKRRRSGHRSRGPRDSTVKRWTPLPLPLSSLLRRLSPLCVETSASTLLLGSFLPRERSTKIFFTLRRKVGRTNGRGGLHSTNTKDALQQEKMVKPQGSSLSIRQAFTRRVHVFRASPEPVCRVAT